jgi:hypothetical protein
MALFLIGNLFGLKLIGVFDHSGELVWTIEEVYAKFMCGEKLLLQLLLVDG